MAGSVQFREGASQGEPGQWPRGDRKITSIGVRDDGGDLEADLGVRHIYSIIRIELRD